MIRIIAMILVLALAAVAGASTVQLEWTPNSEPDLAGYKVYQQTGTATMPFMSVQSVPTTAKPTATISGLDNSKAYFFAVTAINTAGQESAYSNIVSVPAFPKAPAGLKYITVVISP